MLDLILSGIAVIISFFVAASIAKKVFPYSDPTSLVGLFEMMVTLAITLGFAIPTIMLIDRVVN